VSKINQKLFKKLQSRKVGFIKLGKVPTAQLETPDHLARVLAEGSSISQISQRCTFYKS